ncbi:hypothetical protein GGS23DRAFT_607593 [Durotheca rogersii]|uniref:uncharacterized protein n=1 Tax=Durotheca rogersii TaxID=419775 RepID=UPI00221F2443|nr:uncharacterized protein GGS23DRAFT_607593 [Durotheca rogersii]KAI5859396.1 hypothetical protein GGS23DRAFT_607593 [Durotheca rogersii]
MAATLPSIQRQPAPRRPLDSQRNSGGDMSIWFFAQAGLPKRFSSAELQHIRGLNVKSIAKVPFPLPSWITVLEYECLRLDPHQDLSPSVFFSLNMSTYDHALDPSDWDDVWYVMYGRVHPGDSCLQEYTIPALIIRDRGYQPITPRLLSTPRAFPMTPPFISFAGSVLSSDLTLLREELTSGLGDAQQKCCGFILVNPWVSLCKRMVEKRDTHFQLNTFFICTGKVAGFLAHQDYIFIVVPDTWTFHDKEPRNSLPTTSTPRTPSKHLPVDQFSRANFLTPSLAHLLPSSPTTPAAWSPTDPAPSGHGTSRSSP